MGSCVSRRKPSSGGCVLKEPSQNFDKISDETPKKPPPDEPIIIVTPIDPNNVIKFFPTDSFPAETLELLNGKRDLVEKECKKEIKLYVSATFAGNFILIESFSVYRDQTFK
jgi:hypothetical protein